MPKSDWPTHLPAPFYAALAEFNRGEYFACHETLEALWIPERRSVRELYQGMLQIAVGCYHLTQRANRIGAVNLLERGARRLERAFATSCDCSDNLALPWERWAHLYGVNWLGLIVAADGLQAQIRHLGGAELTHADRFILPTIIYDAA